MIRISFVFVGEGSSDDGLITHLENLCIELGADEATGSPVDFQRLPGKSNRPRTVEEKLKAVLQLAPSANLCFIHRDADSIDPEPRYDEIKSGVEASKFAKDWVAVVPVQETEAWLLVDEVAIRSVARKPRGNVNLNLPSPSTVEAKPSPKELLEQALINASEYSGRRLKIFKGQFSDHRLQLLQQLDTKGPITQVKSWQRMRDDLAKAIQKLAATTDDKSKLNSSKARGGTE